MTSQDHATLQVAKSGFKPEDLWAFSLPILIQMAGILEWGFGSLEVNLTTIKADGDQVYLNAWLFSYMLTRLSKDKGVA